MLIEEDKLDFFLLTLYVAEGNNPNPVTLESFRGIIKKDLNTTEDRLIQITIDKLIADGHIRYVHGTKGIFLTEEGKKFIFGNEGYAYRAKKRYEEELIREETLKQLKRSKWSFRISIGALIISVISLLVSIYIKR